MKDSIAKQWLLGIALLCVPTYLLVQEISWFASLAVYVPVSVVALTSFVTHGREADGDIQTSDDLDSLLRTATAYVAQRHARRMQRPWLIVSIVAYISAFLECVCGHDAGRIVWMHVLIDALLAIVSMGIAGGFAENDPPEGADAVLQQLLAYRALASQPYEDLLTKISTGVWVVKDLVSFLTVERAIYKRQAQKPSADLDSRTQSTSEGGL